MNKGQWRTLLLAGLLLIPLASCGTKGPGGASSGGAGGDKNYNAVRLIQKFWTKLINIFLFYCNNINQTWILRIAQHNITAIFISSLMPLPFCNIDFYIK